jgi:ankyrin repeat protein
MRATAFLASVVLAAAALAPNPSGQQLPSSQNDLFEAIRANNVTSIEKVANERGLNTRDASGLTPLVLATAFGTAESVKTLLTLGADANEAAIGGITPLHVAWRDVAVARMLIDRGAKIETRTQLGATPLWIAASANGTADVAALLLARGADANAADSRGVTPLIAAAGVGNTPVAMMLLNHGAGPDAYAPGIGQKTATPLMGAAMNGNVALARTILRSKPDVNRHGPENDGAVKLGPVNLGRITALHLAAASRNPEMVKLLIDSGAAVDARDVRGFTPLVWAIASDHPNPEVLRVLVRAGADVRAAGKSDETPTGWALRYGNPATLSILGVAKPALVPVSVAAHPVFDARAAAERTLPLLRTASTRVMADGGCVACHAQPLTVIATVLATSRGWGTGRDDTSLQQMQQALGSQVPALLQGRESGGQPDGPAFSVFAMSAAGAPPSAATEAFVSYLAAKQRETGNWHALTGRAPMQDGDITRTALAIKALSAYGAPSRQHDLSARVARATRWLESEQPVSAEERVMQLLGLMWGKADVSKLRARQQELLKEQRGDGGWAQAPNLASDAYATGQVLYTLRELPVPASDAALRRGIDFLLRSQRNDGTWHVASRALKIQPYFESGFPYGHDQWISHAGSAWAVIGLAAASANQQNTPR